MSGGFEANDGFYAGEYYHQEQQQQPGQFDDTNNTQFNPSTQWASTDYSQQGYDASAYEQPSQQGYDASAYEQPAYEQPAYEQTAYQQPAYEQQAYDPYAAQSAANNEVFNNPGGYAGSILTPEQNVPLQAKPTQGFEDEPPLLEELGINFDHITQKTLTVLNPLHQLRPEIMEDTDMAGPFVFILGFGASLLLAGKVQFGYIYGVGVLGCIGVYMLLNLMSVHGVSAGCVISVLGYCLLPMDLLSFFAILLSLQGPVGVVLTLVTIAWCAHSASKLFVSALAMDHQQLLVAYPCALLYAVFALLAVF